jgi:hypothetical protein
MDRFRGPGCVTVFHTSFVNPLADTGLDVYESIPVGPRIVAGVFQGLAARASGLAIVPIAALAPAVQ